MCDTPEYVDIRQVLVHLYVESQSGNSMCVTHVDRRQVLVHLYIETQPGCRICLTHLNTWVEGKFWFICI